MSNDKDDPVMQELKAMKAQMDEMYGMLRPPEGSGVTGEQQDYRTEWLAARAGDQLGREQAAFNQKYAHKFDRAVSLTVVTMSRAQKGMLNVAAMMARQPFPWAFFIFIGAVALIVYGILGNPVYSVGLSSWLGAAPYGVSNAVIFMVFLAVIVIGGGMVWRRRSSPARVQVG